MENKNLPKYIGITGKIGSGKTTLAGHLTEKYGYEEYNMALPLKKIGEILGFEKSELWGTQEEKLAVNEFWKVSGRKFLQLVGTELFREQLPKLIPSMEKIWVRCFELECKKNPEKRYVIGDIRFLDEEETIRKLGGCIIKTVRGVKQSEVNLHSSENELDKIKPDFTIDNNFFSKEEVKAILNDFLTK